MDNTNATLQSTEARLAPFTLACSTTCAIGGAVLLACSAVVSPLWVVCLAVWLALSGSNARFMLVHDRPSVGMVPVAIVSLGPAALANLLAGTSYMMTALDACLLCVASLGAVIFGSLFARMHAAYAHARPIARDAVIIVLGGATKDGAPKRTLTLRLDKATQVADERSDATLILTGGPTDQPGDTEADVMYRYFVSQGTRTEQMLREPTATNTEQNIERSLELVRERSLRGQLCVLSSDYHLYRALAIGDQLGIALVPIAAPTPSSGKLQQWSREALTILWDRMR